MVQESRVKKTLLNARVNLIFYFLSLILSFFSRKIFLNTLGADFVGLTGTLYNLLAFLNLAELGIGSAIGYVLYKPLYDHDENKICEIISVFGYLYRWIGLIILGTGCVLAGFLPLIFPATGFEYGIIYFAYFSFLASSLIGYFANYKQTLLGADQKNYVVTAYFQTATIVKTLIQLASAYYTGSYYLWVAIELVFGILYSFILNWKINQVYPWLKSEVKQGKELFKKYPEVMTKTKQLFVHQISLFTQFQTKPFLIYSFVSLQTVAYYGNYTIIIDKLTTLVTNFLGSNVTASIGNLIADGNREKTQNIFWEILAIRFLLTGCLSFALYHLFEPFVSLWLGHQYILSKIVLLLTLCDFSIRMISDIFGQFLYGFGLLQDIWAPIAQSVIYLFFAVICGYYFGLEGVLFGGIISLLVIICLWKPYFLFTKGFKISFVSYWKGICGYLAIFIISLFFVSFIITIVPINPFESALSFILYAIIIIGIYALIYFMLLYAGTKGMRRIVHRLLYKRKL